MSPSDGVPFQAPQEPRLHATLAAKHVRTDNDLSLYWKALHEVSCACEAYNIGQPTPVYPTIQVKRRVLQELELGLHFSPGASSTEMDGGGECESRGNVLARIYLASGYAYRKAVRCRNADRAPPAV